MSAGGTVGFPFKGLFLVVACAVCCAAEKKIKYSSTTLCDRYSLDAVYHEKFKIITDNVFKDCIEFVIRVSDSISDSLTTIMGQLPDRAASDIQEKKVFGQFKAAKDGFSSRARRLNRRIVAAWEWLVAGHFDLMDDNATLADYVDRTRNMTDAYGESRKSLDVGLGGFISFVKNTVRDGIQGISAAAASAAKKEAKEKRNDTKITESEEEKLKKKKLEIAEMISQGFLGQVTVEVIKRDIDLFAKVDLKTDERESILDDLEFDVLMIKNRVLAIIQPDLPRDKGSVDLARRSIYTYWADLADHMYQERIKGSNSGSTADLYYRKLWGDDTTLMNTLLDLMEVYA